MDVQPEQDKALNTGNELNQALRRSHELLDTGNLRAVRGPFGRHSPREDEACEEFEVFVCSSLEEKSPHYESFMASHEEIHGISQMNIHFWKRDEEGMGQTYQCGCNQDFSGREVTMLRAEVANGRVVESRCVKTRRECPDDPEKTETGDRSERKSGRIFANPPREGIPGVPPHSVIEMTKRVYGLMDAPKQWWKCFTSFLC